MTRSFQLPSDSDRREVDPQELQAFAAGAAQHRVNQEPFPWEGLNPDDVPRHNVPVRLNQYELEMLRWLSKQCDVSQQKLLKRAVLPAVKKQVAELTGGHPEGKS